MIVVYDSNTGIGKRFAESLGYPTQNIKEAGPSAERRL